MASYVSNSRSIFRLYPFGVGDAEGQHISAFLRTVKSHAELNNNSWSRPISHFCFKLKKNGNSSPPISTSSLTSENDFISQYSEPEFKEFKESRQGSGLFFSHI